MILEIKLVIPTSQKQPLVAAAAQVKKKGPSIHVNSYYILNSQVKHAKVFDYY